MSARHQCGTWILQLAAVPPEVQLDEEIPTLCAHTSESLENESARKRRPEDEDERKANNDASGSAARRKSAPE